MKGNLLSSTNC